MSLYPETLMDFGGILLQQRPAHIDGSPTARKDFAAGQFQAVGRVASHGVQAIFTQGVDDAPDTGPENGPEHIGQGSVLVYSVVFASTSGGNFCEARRTRLVSA